MKKIPTLFKRDFSKPKHPIIPEYNNGVEWVLNGEGIATRKYDGMCCMVRDHKLYKRYEVKDGRIAPPSFELVDIDSETGKSYGWVPVGSGPEDKYFREALGNASTFDKVDMCDGTFELLGPKVQSNPENLSYHILLRHENAEAYNPQPPTSFDKLHYWLEDLDIEGIVWHHPDGRMVKIKKKDFGLRRLNMDKKSFNIDVVAHDLDPNKKYLLVIDKRVVSEKEIRDLQHILEDNMGIHTLAIRTESVDSIHIEELPDK